MKIKKISQFIKQYGFYLAVVSISVIAIIAMFIIPKNDGNVKDTPNSYANNLQADGSVKEPYDSNVIDMDNSDEEYGAEEEENTVYFETDNLEVDSLEDSNSIEQSEADLDQEEVVTNDADNTSEEVVTNDTDNTSEEVTDTNEATEIVENTEDNVDEVNTVENEEVQTETFDSTTVSVTDEPFFADGDKFSWPVEGEIVVPYTDNSTKHWFSESFNYTMSTFGICISAPEATDVVAVAKGRVLEVIESSSEALGDNTPYLGTAVVVDHGNGYQTVYGFQGGTVNSDLIGQVVNEGDVLGQVGSPKGAFVSVGSNIYLQLKHNDEIINPTTYLQSVDNETDKEDSVDVGFAE